MAKLGRPRSTNKVLTKYVTTKLAEDEVMAMDAKAKTMGKSRAAVLRLALLAWLGIGATLLLVGCGGQSPDVVQTQTVVVTRPAACTVSLTAPVMAQGADGSAGGNCDVSPWDGAPGDQVFNLYSNAGGASVRASIRRSAPQGSPVLVGGGQANVWDWTHDCDRWAGVVVWEDVVSADPDYGWIEHHDWSVSVDVSCVDDGYRIVGSWAGHI